MKVLFDTSVWIDELRHGALSSVIARVRGKYVPWVDAVVAGELLAGACRKAQRRAVEKMLAPFEKTERVAVPGAGDYRRAGLALAGLRREGRTLKNPGSALLDALQAADAARMGALLVTRNSADFEKLARHLPLRFASFDDFRRSL